MAKTAMKEQALPKAGEQSELTQLTDTFLYGNPATRRLEQISARYSFPEYVGGYGLDQNLWALYEEILLKDGHFIGIVGQRLRQVLSQPWRIRARKGEITAPVTDEENEAAHFVTDAINEIENWNTDMEQMLGAIPRGICIMEIVWEQRADYYLPAELKQRYAGHFKFDKTGKMFYAKDSAPVAPMKYIVIRHEPTYENPYGTGLCHKVQWYYWFKKHNVKFWAIYNEKYGSPLPLLKGKQGVKEEEINKMLDTLEHLQKATGIYVPESFVLDFEKVIESGRTNTYNAFCDWCNMEMSKIVLGETLTISEGERSGSFALGRIHQSVLEQFLEQDAKLISDTLTAQLVRAIVMVNLGERERYPVFEIITDPDEDPKIGLEIDQKMLGMGLSLSLRDLYERYNRRQPMAGDQTIRQLPYERIQALVTTGVLTVNEVRAEMGLAPVEWGNEPIKAASPLGFAERRAPFDKFQERNPRGQAMKRIWSRWTRDFLDRVVETGVENAIESLHEIYASIQRVAKEAVALEDVLREAETMSSDPVLGIAEEIARGLIVGRVAGLQATKEQLQSQELDVDEKIATAFADPGESFRLEASDTAKQFMKRKAMSKEEFDLLTERIRKSRGGTIERAVKEAHEVAFTVTKKAAAVILGDLQASIRSALKGGMTLDEFQKQYAGYLSEFGATPKARAYLETVYRTNVMKSYQRAKDELYNDPEVADGIWGYEFFNPDDERSTPECAALNGFCAPKNDPRLDSIGDPPFHYNCRTDRIAIVDIPMNREIMKASADPVYYDEDGNPVDAIKNLQRY